MLVHAALVIPIVVGSANKTVQPQRSVVAVYLPPITVPQPGLVHKLGLVVIPVITVRGL